MLGSAIGLAIEREGANVLRLVRRPANEPDELRWDPAAGQVRRSHAALTVARAS